MFQMKCRYPLFLTNRRRRKKIDPWVWDKCFFFVDVFYNSQSERYFLFIKQSNQQYAGENNNEKWHAIDSQILHLT